jgi:Mn2+/Fe2+ NRAMP family transporter
MTIGAFTVYGTGQLLPENSTAFSNQLLSIFTTNLGEWTYPVIAIAAFGTIYGTLIAAWDAFAKSFVRGIQILRSDELTNNKKQEDSVARWYNVLLPLIGFGGFILFYQFKGGMIKILEAVTIIVFLVAPIIAYLNLRVINSEEIPETHRVSKSMLLLAYAGLILMALFSIYYLTTI